MMLAVRGFCGTFMDMFSLALLKPIHPHSYTKFKIINYVRKKTGARICIEVGTYKGITAYRLSKVFDFVYTIELDDKLARVAAQFLRKRKNVRVIQGDGIDLLPELLASEAVDRVLIFLDGHYSGG